jgi:general secretion pathway protein D
VTTFAPIATGGVAQQPVTSFNYRNIGVNIDITPRIHHDDDVTLALKVEISSLSGTGYGGLPTFGNRSINTEIRLRDGETNMLAGLIRDDERETKEGIAGLSDLPVIGQIFGRTHKEATETDIILTLTPHIVRVLDLHEADLAPFRLERAGSLPTILEAPGNGTIMPVPGQPAQPDQPPVPPASRPILPILPPEPTPPPTQPTPPTPQ